MMSEPAVEELDLEALLKGGTIKPKPSASSSAAASSSSGQQSRSAPSLQHVAASAPVGTVFEDDAIVDSSSWSESDEEGGGAAEGEDNDKDSSEEKKPDTAASADLEDPLGILGNLNLKQYDARYDLASVKFDPAALLSGVHYATSYDKLRTALETLKPLHLQTDQKKGVSLGITEVRLKKGKKKNTYIHTLTCFKKKIVK